MILNFQHFSSIASFILLLSSVFSSLHSLRQSLPSFYFPQAMQITPWSDASFFQREPSSSGPQASDPTSGNMKRSHRGTKNILRNESDVYMLNLHRWFFIQNLTDGNVIVDVKNHWQLQCHTNLDEHLTHFDHFARHPRCSDELDFHSRSRQSTLFARSPPHYHLFYAARRDSSTSFRLSPKVGVNKRF